MWTFSCDQHHLLKNILSSFEWFWYHVKNQLTTS